MIVLFLIAERGAGIGGVANLLKVWFKGHSVAFRAGVHGCWISIDEDSEFDASADSGMDSASVLSRARNRVKGICKRKSNVVLRFVIDKQFKHILLYII